MLTLSSDFGSPYPAAMKGVAAHVTDARLVDVTHDLPRQNVRASAFWLCEVLPYFPPAVHLAVVDPGVGTDRAAVAIRAGEHVLVGPDNGVLLPAARALAGDTPVEAFEIPYGQDTPDVVPISSDLAGVWPDDPASSTFHGRDVFAPAAAHVHEAGVDSFPTVLSLPRLADVTSISFPDPQVEADGAVGEVIAVDDFGNVITTIPGSVLDQHVDSHVEVNGVWAAVRRAYADVDPGHRVVTVGSHGNVELAVNQGRGDDTFGVDAGSRVRLSW